MASEFDAAVAKCIGMLAETFGRTASGPMIDGYRIGLTGLSPQAVKHATAFALQKCKFMPSSAELREMAGEIKSEDRAELAWLAFDSAISQHSVYKTLIFDDPVINAVVRSLGGVGFIIEMTDEDYQFLRARFLKAYVAMARSGVNGDAVEPMIGYFDRVNGADAKSIVHIKTGLPPLPHLSQQQPESLTNKNHAEILKLKNA